MFIYFCEDDPIINRTCIEFEEASKNQNVMICSNKYGGHLCSYEHFLMVDQFLPKPAFEFLEYFRKNNTTCLNTLKAKQKKMQIKKAGQELFSKNSSVFESPLNNVEVDKLTIKTVKMSKKDIKMIDDTQSLKDAKKRIPNNLSCQDEK